MKTVFFKKISILFLCCMCTLTFCACGESLNNNVNFIDATVDMTPRLISIENNSNLTDVIEQVRSAVVGISAKLNGGYSVGSGVAVAQGGYILTNHHVVNGASELTVYFANKTQSIAETIWSDSALDLAIIKSAVKMPYLEFGNINNLKIGQDILAIGTPITLQFTHTVTKGIISALNRTLEVEGTNGVSYLQNLIQHDASINPGNSGGPLVSTEGKVVGINTLKASEAEGIGFAIPINVGRAVVEKVVANNSYKAPYLGIFGFDATIAQYYGYTMEENGVYIVDIDSAGPAGVAGVQKSDVIIGINDSEINSMLDLRVSLYQFEVGEEITMTIMRDNQEIQVKFTANERP